MKVTSIIIIDYGSGNLHSASKAFERAAQEQNRPAEIIVTADPDRVALAERVVLPGVGAFADCRAGLYKVDGLAEALVESVIKRGAPFFGICVGMQLMASRGLEKEISTGFGWIAGDVVKIKPSDPTLKIPHMGWNTLDVCQSHPMLAGIPTCKDGQHAYFVHSYHMQPENPDRVLATSDYAGPITAIIGRDNLFGAQFHPEKSQALGLAMIGNFLHWKP